MSYHSDLAGGASVEQEAALLAGRSDWEPGATSDKSLSCVSIQNSFPLAGVRVNKQGQGSPSPVRAARARQCPWGPWASLGRFWATAEAPCPQLCPSPFKDLGFDVRESHAGVYLWSPGQAWGRGLSLADADRAQPLSSLPWMTTPARTQNLTFSDVSEPG